MILSPGHTRYLATAAHLRDLIAAGVYPPGSQLPSERDLRHLCDCGLDAVRDAMSVLRRELLVTTARGFRATVCTPPQRANVTLLPGTVVTAWMPILPDLDALDCRPEMPVLTVTDPTGGSARYPADRVALVVPASIRA